MQLPSYAQSQNSVKLNIVFNHIQNLTVNPAQTVTTLAYNTLADFENGVELVQKEHLTVFSTGAYVVKVKVAGEDFIKMGGQATQNLTLPQVTISALPVKQDASVLLETTVLSTAGKSIITSNHSAFNESFDVKYKGPGGNVFLDYVSNNETSTYTNTVFYTIETK